jgi:hypothetical protein
MIPFLASLLLARAAPFLPLGWVMLGLGAVWLPFGVSAWLAEVLDR